MPIVRSGYRSDDDRRELQRFYSSAAWRQARLFVLARDGNVCRWCGDGPDEGRPLDVVHLSRVGTLALLRTDPAAALDVERLAAGHRRCHRKYAAGMLEDPPPRKSSDGSSPWGAGW